MESNLPQLRMAILDAVTILRQDTQALDARVQAAQAMLLAALVRENAAAPADAAPPAHGLDVVGVTASLDATTVRLRDELAVTLELEWQVISAFMPPPTPGPMALPPRPDAVPPSKPWYLVDAATTQILTGPFTEPLPANGLYLTHPLATTDSDLVVLCDAQNREDDLLPHAWANSDRRGNSTDEEAEEEEYDDGGAQEDAQATAYRVELEELVRLYGHAQCV